MPRETAFLRRTEISKLSVSWATRALQSIAFRQRFPARHRNIVHRHLSGREKPVRHFLPGDLRAFGDIHPAGNAAVVCLPFAV